MGTFLLETLDTFPLLKDAYTQSRKLYENQISSWYGALQQILNNTRNTQQNTTKLGILVNFMCVYKCPVRSQIDKEVKENNNNNKKNQIQSWPFIYKPGEHRQQFKGGKNAHNYKPNEFDRMRVKQFLSETVAMHP